MLPESVGQFVGTAYIGRVEAIKAMAKVVSECYDTLQVGLERVASHHHTAPHAHRLVSVISESWADGWLPMQQETTIKEMAQPCLVYLPAISLAARSGQPFPSALIAPLS